MLAAENGHLEIVDLLLSSQAEVNQTKVSDSTMCTPTKTKTSFKKGVL